MASRRRDPSPLLVPLAGLAALLPEPAEACSPDPCNGVAALKSIEVLNPVAIPIDGVLLLRANGDMDKDSLLADLELTVTRDGQPIAGAVEDSTVIGVLVWRPAAQLEPGDYKLHALFDNPPIDYDYCGPDIVDDDLVFNVGAGLSEPLTPPTIEPVITELLVEDRELDTLVCCDGAYPEDYNLCGYSYDVTWFEGECAATSAVGVLDISFALKQTVAPSTAGLLIRTLRVDGDIQRLAVEDGFWHTADHPFCASFDLRNVATGETLLGEPQCFGKDPGIVLGPQALDPAVALAGKCVGEPYTCEFADGVPSEWDPEKCTPWAPAGETSGDTSEPTTSDTGPDTSATGGTAASDTADTSDQDGLGDRGCGCATDPADPGALLGLLGVGLLVRRRRRD